MLGLRSPEPQYMLRSARWHGHGAGGAMLAPAVTRSEATPRLGRDGWCGARFQLRWWGERRQGAVR